MKIKVIDAFGTHIGDAEVKWIIPDDATRRQQRDYQTQLFSETGKIFEPEITVLLPTKDERAPWRMEVTP